MYICDIFFSKSEFKSGSQRSFPGRGEYEFVFQFWYCKTNGVRHRRPNFFSFLSFSFFFFFFFFFFFCSLECFNCWWVDGGDIKQKILFAAGWNSFMFLVLVLFKDKGCRVSPKFHIFFSDVNQGNKEMG